MNIRKVLLGSAASLVAISGAQAADAIVAPEPEAVEYVRVCDAYGAGYFYIPGTETCLRIHGYVRYDASGGDNNYARTPAQLERDTWNKLARVSLRFSTASETDLGTLKTYSELRYDWTGDGNGKADNYNGGSTSTSLRYAYIQLGGLRVGLDESAFVTFTGYLGNVISDDVILAGGYRTNLISYTFKGGNGFSAIVSFEEGGNSDSNVDVTIKDYMPHVVGGLKYEQSWGKIAGVVAYDARNEEWAGRSAAMLTSPISSRSGCRALTSPMTTITARRAVIAFVSSTRSTVPGAVIGQSGAVQPTRQPARRPSTYRPLMTTAKPSLQRQTLPTSWFLASPSRLKFPTPSGRTRTRAWTAKTPGRARSASSARSNTLANCACSGTRIVVEL